MARILQHWMKAYVEYTKHLEAPDTFHLWAAVATIAGALRGKCWIDMGYFKWKPNFFIVFVAPPGVVSKSTTVGVGMSMLREVPGIHFGPDSATWQALTSSFAESTEYFDDISMSAITIAASELGTFLDPHNREMIDVLVDLWDGRDIPWKRHTKADGESEIANPWLNFIGCTTPAWIEGNFPEYAIGGGFTSRTIFVYAEAKRHLEAYPKERMTEEFAPLRKALVADLNNIAQITGEYTLTKDAKELGESWYEKHWQARHEHLAGDRFGGYIARKQTHVHKLALVIAASQRNERIITADDLTTADILVSALEENLPLVFQRISDSREAKYTAAVLSALRTTHSISKQELWRKLYHLMSAEQFDLALGGVVRAGFVKLYQKGEDMFISITPAGDKLFQGRSKARETSFPNSDPQSDPSIYVPSPKATDVGR